MSYSGPSVVVAVHGEVNVSTAAQLGEIVTAVIDGGHSSVILDLARCTFLDASGLGVMAIAARRVSYLPLSQTFTVRAPSDLVHRIMVLTGMDQVLLIEQPRSTLRGLVRDQTTGSTGGGVGFDADSVAQALRHMTAIPAERDLVDGALRLVVALARATIEGADGVSVSLNRNGALSTVAASDQTILDMDADQYATGEGPCVDASNEGRWFHVGSLAAETRWPAFIPKARTLGINAILSNPLLVGDRPVGALNIYSNRSEAFHVEDQRLAAVFATEASTVLTSVGARATDEQVAGRLIAALQIREIIAQAQGILMKQEGIPADAAYALLRESSRTSNRSIRDLAEETVSLSLGRGDRATAATEEHGE